MRMITRQKINLNDYVFNVGNLRIDSDEGFNIETTELRYIPYDNLIWNSVTFEMSD